MAADNDAPDDRTTELRRIRMPDGGEVLTGKLAGDALGAVDARAMTMDRTIFVDEGFNPGDAEDQALYAHERHHQRNSGGEGEHGGGHDAEEKAAKTIEAMVLHRRGQGDDFGKIMQDVESGKVDDPKQHGGAPDSQGSNDEADPMTGYRSMRNSGWDHDTVVRHFASQALREMVQSEREHKERAPIGPRSVV